MPSSSPIRGAQTRRESHRTLPRLALIGTNYFVHVNRDRTNSRWISWFKRKFALTPISLTRAGTLRTKLNRSSEWLLEFSSSSNLLSRARSAKFYLLILCPERPLRAGSLFNFHISTVSRLLICRFFLLCTRTHRTPLSPLSRSLSISFSPFVFLVRQYRNATSHQIKRLDYIGQLRDIKRRDESIGFLSGHKLFRARNWERERKRRGRVALAVEMVNLSSRDRHEIVTKWWALSLVSHKK